MRGDRSRAVSDSVFGAQGRGLSESATTVQIPHGLGPKAAGRLRANYQLIPLSPAIPAQDHAADGRSRSNRHPTETALGIRLVLVPAMW